MMPNFNILLKLFLLLSCYLQLIESFCVYNQLSGDRVKLRVGNPFVAAPTIRIFTKIVAQGTRVCCPYDNADCVAGLKKDSPIELKLRFAFDLITLNEADRQYTTYCEGGGGIIITGSNFNDIESTCHKVNGDVVREKLIDWVPV
ncbi:uncharacterized protein EV154DRAFT_566298 [Mucor mucedo]|uniref:uncharacterized protein n=1 Tax=Mucor mucedo TaxID=29922 RepID=UPI00222062B0|nr:uncharacterized protein EV154DRAFT_566298 [Mucor mucedo]KAI7888543.1 hypothetical protein EV154DRAFT_566298 [Mucor mucedo]